jgi:SulP family sulfate permease
MDLYLTGLKGPVCDMAGKSGLKKYLGEDHFCRTPHQAVVHILKKMDTEDNGNRLETYQKIRD